MLNLKHVGKLKNGSKVVVLFRTVPNEDNNCLVTETGSLPSLYHDRLMELVESEEGQQSNDLADLLNRRFFADGNNILATLHNQGFIKKVNTSNVYLTPNSKSSVPLSEVNEILSGKNKNDPSTKNIIEKASKAESALDDVALANSLLAQAKSYEKEAARLREQAKGLMPDVEKKRRGRPKAS